MAVYSSNKIKTEFASAGSSTFHELTQTTTITKTQEANVEEWDAFNNVWKQRLVTGGKSITFSIEKKMDPSASADKALRDIIFTDTIEQHNNCKLRLTFPKSNTASTDARTETYTGVVQPTADGADTALSVGVIKFDFLSSGAPEVVEES